MKLRHLAAVAGCLASLAIARTWAQPMAEGSEMFPFVLPWDDASAGVADVSGWLEKPAGKMGFVAAREGHLFEGNQRIRFMGVNMAFDANFPNHEDAEKIAARLAKFGINCVRFHHMDTITYPTGLLEKDNRTINKDQLDKLDYFIAQLKAHGIYSNINLHVGRHYPGEPEVADNPYYKGVDQFVPRMIELQKDFARDILTHVNPYTKTAYVNEPAVAFVEINNENGLIHSWWGGGFDKLPAAHQTELAKQWNAWLAAKYGNDVGKLRGAWNVGAQESGGQMLDGDFSRWHLEQHEGAQATRTMGQGKADLPPELAGNDAAGSVKIAVTKPAAQGWYVQYSHPGMALKGGQSYTMEVWAKASAPRDISLVAGQAHDPWNTYGSKRIKLTEKWQKFSMTFQPGADEDKARVMISGMGLATGEFQFAGATLRTAQILGVTGNENIGTIPPLTKESMAKRTLAAQKDWIRFLWDTEEKYWLDMQTYLKKDLRCKSLVIGTQMGYSPFPIQAKLDVVDVHGYWQHPHFPGRPWDGNNWIVGNKSMVTAEGAGELGHMAATRVYGKPYICTEYNHAAPNPFTSETFLLAAAFAAQQDWDGIFAFAYSHNQKEAKSGKISGFFDLAQHPTKMATMPAAVAMFVRGDVPGLDPSWVTLGIPTFDDVLEAVRTKGPSPNIKQLPVQESRATPFLNNEAGVIKWPVALVVPGEHPSLSAEVTPVTRESLPSINWKPFGADQVFIHSERSMGFVGFANELGLGMSQGKSSIKFERSLPQGWQPGKPPFDKRWCTITATVMDGNDFTSAKRVLIVATGAAENTDMGWKNPEKTTVGRDWGKAPSLVEGIDATITLSAAMKVWALDEKGQRREEVPVVKNGAGVKFDIGPKYRTLWYEAAR